MRTQRDELRWNGWGRSDVQFNTHGQDDAVWAFVAQALGATSLPHTPAPTLEKTTLPASRASESLLSALREATDASRVYTGTFERAFHAYGRSYYDLLRLRSGALESAPDVVVYPTSKEEVLALLRCAELHRFAVIPFGGGSSVVGGVEALRGDKEGVLTIDTTLMTRVLHVDGVSRTAKIEAGIYGPELEAQMASRGFILGHQPQSFEYSTLGGWVAARGSGQLSNRYGSADKLLVGSTLVTPRGILETGGFPASAAGPNLNHVVAGAEGTLGVITDVTMRLHPAPASRSIFAFLFKRFDEGAAAIRTAVQEEVGAAMMRLSDIDETRFYGAFRGVLEPSPVHTLTEGALGLAGYEDKCVLMVCIEGEAEEVKLKQAKMRKVAKGHGGFYVGQSPGKSWWKRRFEMPFMRDPMLDRGVGIDTLETSTEWSNVPRLYDAVRAAIRGYFEKEGKKVIVMTHISHSYIDGASLYFTFIFLRDDARSIAQWKGAKHAASIALVEHGGTISHHHGVGLDHTPYMAEEKGILGIALLKGMRSTLDPAGIMNPTKLTG